MSSIVMKTEEIMLDNVEYGSDDGDEMHLSLEDTGGEYATYSEISPSGGAPNSLMAANKSGHHTTIGQNGKTSMDNDKKIRRQIANSNERRRMQSINAGFQSLRSLLPHHEGEKLSKAAILQQTAQYIYDLENEKTKLLTQNSQLKRLMGQHEIAASAGNGGNNVPPPMQTPTPTSVDDKSTGTITAISSQTVSIKKRKLADNVISMQTISDSSDEGLGSMSPEPITLLASGAVSKTAAPAVVNNGQQQHASASVKEVGQLRSALDTERRKRTELEDRIHQLERDMRRAHEQIQYQPAPATQYYSARQHHEEVALLEIEEYHAAEQQEEQHVVVCSTLDTTLEELEETEEGEAVDEISIREEIISPDDSEMTQYVEVSSRLQPILEAAIKAEPKVEVERINETTTLVKSDPNSPTTKNRVLLTSTSRQNLETIVEAIRHLEGDSLFDNDAEQKKAAKKTTQHQEAPLALTTSGSSGAKPVGQRRLKAELSPFFQFKKQQNGTLKLLSTNSNSVKLLTKAKEECDQSGIKSKNLAPIPTQLVKVQTTPAASAAQPSQVTITSSTVKQQCRPGVIVGKQQQQQLSSS